MSQDRPTAAELVQAVREFLERDVMAATEGRTNFHTRVAVNALGMVERELTLGAELVAVERMRAAALLGHDGAAPALERELAARIRSGALDDELPAVFAHVRATVREKLQIANPKYLPNNEAVSGGEAGASSPEHASVPEGPAEGIPPPSERDRD